LQLIKLNETAENEKRVSLKKGAERVKLGVQADRRLMRLKVRFVALSQKKNKKRKKKPKKN
jgi:hypothetical protein